MILTKVILQDYGVYRGKNEFDFTCTDDRPIVLIGGTNGAGKTTLFESIMLGLYGISVMGKRTTQKAYNKFLARKIHRYLKSSTSADFASIVVQFKFFHLGKVVEYKIDRMWSGNEQNVEERLVIKKRHVDSEKFEPLDTIEESQWQLFVEDLIPKGIVKLFFFDGEKIVKIAKEGKEDLAIRDSFKSLLGIELVEQLRTDLQVNLSRNLTSGGKSLQHDFEEYKAEKQEITDLTGRLQDRLAQKQNEIDSMNKGIETLESKISKIGGQFANKREDAKIQLAAKTASYDEIKRRMQDVCSKTLPFSLIPGQLKILRGHIMHDQLIQRDKIREKILYIKTDEIDSHLETKEFWAGLDVEKDSREKIREKIKSLLAERTDSPQETMFNLSGPQQSEIFGIIQNANTVALEEFGEDAQKINLLSDEIAKIQSFISNAPDDDEIGPLVSELGRLNKSAGELNAEMDHIGEKISNNAAMSVHIDVKIRDIVSQMYRDEKSKTGVELTQNVQTILEEFVQILKIKKIRLLEQYILDAMHVLLHKQNFVEKIAVDSDTFEVTLYRGNGDPLPKDLLSEGEKQMFATSVLWALAKTSGRPLPFMIDTPLARLDDSHRTNIVEKFLPFASHQILIFSTDKEIEYEHYEKIESCLSRSYAMEYRDENGATQIHDGYFWNKKGEKIVAI